MEITLEERHTPPPGMAPPGEASDKQSVIKLAEKAERRQPDEVGHCPWWHPPWAGATLPSAAATLVRGQTAHRTSPTAPFTA